nr:DUF5071 domain-containing protein [Paenibacillus glycanilyticus]
MPKDKFDMEAINKLKMIAPGNFSLQPIIEKLFEWIQDCNWPIAQELCTILALLRPEDIIPQIRMVLNSGDDGWQFSCIYFLIPNLPDEVKKEIGPDILRVFMSPTKNEELCEIDLAAREIYKKYIKKLS